MLLVVQDQDDFEVVRRVLWLELVQLRLVKLDLVKRSPLVLELTHLSLSTCLIHFHFLFQMVA